MSWWVGAYIEAGMGASGSSGTPYLPFTFQAPTRAQAEQQDRAKLLAGPFSTQAQAQQWATDYERNPNTLHAGSGLSPSTGTVKGDNPPVPASGLQAIGDFFARLTEGSTWIRLAEGVLGVILLAVGLARISHAVPAATAIARKVGAVGLASA